MPDIDTLSRTSDTDKATRPTGGTNSDLAAALAAARGSRSGWRWVRRLAVLLVIGGGIASYLMYHDDGSGLTYVTAEAHRGPLTVIVTATGSVEPTVQVDVSSEQSGTVREVLADFNSTVTKGEVIARLDSEKLQADVKSAEAKLRAAQASVAKSDADMKAAKVSLDRLTSLVGNRVSSQQDLDAAQYKYDATVATKESAEADVLAAQAALRLAEVNLSKATIVSPIDGIVLARNVDPGATVAASLEAPTLFTIAGDLKEMELQVAIDEADVGQVAVGQTATFNVDAFPDRSFPAEISSVRYASKTVNDVVTYLGILTVHNDEMLLRQGMTATADITVQALKDALLVPNAALRYSPPQQLTESGGRGLFSIFRPPRMGALTSPEPAGRERRIWVLRNGAPVAIDIEIGASDGQNTVVTKGDLNAGEQVITDARAQNG